MMKEEEEQATKAIMQKEVPCWICGSPGTTREHLIKRSDLKAGLGAATQRKPYFIHTLAKKNIPVKSWKNDRVKTRHKVLCAVCNNQRTQPFDRAWEQVLEKMLVRKMMMGKSGFFRPNQLVAFQSKAKFLDTHLYFAKNLGCRLADGLSNIFQDNLRAAILARTPCQNLYLRFGTFDGEIITGLSELRVYSDGKSTTDCNYYYEVAGLSIEVSYLTEPNAHVLAKKGFWNPRAGYQRIAFHKFGI